MFALASVYDSISPFIHIWVIYLSDILLIPAIIIDLLKVIHNITFIYYNLI